MYGLIIDHIVTYIRERYGEATWTEVKFVSGVEEDNYAMDSVFSEGLPHKLVWATHDVTGDSVDLLMTNIGFSFYRFLGKYEFNKIVRVLGRTFPQFLNGLDNLHEYLRFSFPKLKPPSFYCEHESRTGLTLHYRSKRRGFLHYVKGQIKCIAKELFSTDVEIEILDHENDNSMDHVIMRLHFNNIDFKTQDLTYQLLAQGMKEKIRISSDIFFDIFPFIIVFNRGMRIRNVGIGLLRVMNNLVGKKINQKFVLMRPFIRFRWEEIMLHSNNIFELMSTDSIWDDDDDDEQMYVYKSDDVDQMAQERSHMSEKEREKFLMLKGQMFYMEDWESICFMGIPVMSNLNQMHKSQLYINDFALHDSSRDLVLASTQQAAELKLLLHQEAQKSLNMTENMKKLKKERNRTDRLLYQLLPRAIAEKLRTGESAVACCEQFECVTILFTDVVGFTDICSQLNSIEVVEFLNEMYSVFDKLIDDHGVYKVETIGDAYMVVSGAPERNEDHAEFALDCAISFVGAVGELDSKYSKADVQIRAGIHTGPAMAGIVGLKMPRYCLFGSTVQLANMMEQSGKPMKVHVSEVTKLLADRTVPDTFTWKEAKLKDPNPKIEFRTFFCTGKKGAARVPAHPGGDGQHSVMSEGEEEDEIEQVDTEHGRNTPTTLAAIEVQRRRRMSYTPVSEAEIESYSRSPSAVKSSMM